MDQATRSATATNRPGQQFSSGELSDRERLHPTDDFVTYLRDYARQKPDIAALWCFGIGFVLGWKLKPW